MRFKKGDKVICIEPTGSLVKNAIYTIKTTPNTTGVTLEEVEPNPGYCVLKAKRFKFVDSSTFPTNWIVKGENLITKECGILKIHWFIKCRKALGNSKPTSIGFYNDHYYTKSGFYNTIPAGFTLVTKEELIKHCNIKTEETHEVSKKITESKRTSQQGTRATSEKIKLASSSRLIGSRNTNFRKRTGIRTVKISYNKLFSNENRRMSSTAKRLGHDF